MITFIVKRLLWSVLVLLGISLITFVLLAKIPGDPAKVLAGEHAPPNVLAEIRHGWGLDQPLPLRYLRYVGHALRGDLGRSYIQDEDVLPAILSRLPQTVELAVCGLLCELLVAFPLGVMAAAAASGSVGKGRLGRALARLGSLVDRLLLAVTALAFSTPTFLVCLILLLVLGSWLNLLPLGGYGDPWPKYVLLPALSIGIPGGAWYSRLLRASLLETLRLEFVRTARAKGASRSRVLLRHVLPIAALPLLPIIGADLAALLGGVVVVESVVNWPGIGLQAFTALKGPDTPLVMGTVLFAGLGVVLINLAVDLGVALLDPRVRLHG